MSGTRPSPAPASRNGPREGAPGRKARMLSPGQPAQPAPSTPVPVVVPHVVLKVGGRMHSPQGALQRDLSFLSSSSAPSKAPSPYWLLPDGHHAATGLCAWHPETRRGSSRSEERMHRCVNTFSLPYGEGEPDLRTVPFWRNHTLALRDSKGLRASGGGSSWPRPLGRRPPGEGAAWVG